MGKYFRGHLKRNKKNQERWRGYDCLPGFCYFLEVNLILGAAFKNSGEARHVYNSRARINKPRLGLTKGPQRSEDKCWVVDRWTQSLPTLGQTLLRPPASEGSTRGLPPWKQEPFCPRPRQEGCSDALGGGKPLAVRRHQQTHPCLPKPGVVSLGAARQRSRWWSSTAPLIWYQNGAALMHFLCHWNACPGYL